MRSVMSCGMKPPCFGSNGACTARIYPSSCTPACNSGYTRRGQTTCSAAGALTDTATCLSQNTDLTTLYLRKDIPTFPSYSNIKGWSNPGTSLTYSVPNSQRQVFITPYKCCWNAAIDASTCMDVAKPSPKIAVNGVVVASLGFSSNILVAEGGVTPITIVVTAEDEIATKSITLQLSRAPSNNAALQSLSTNADHLNPSFSSTVLSYTVSVANSLRSLRLYPTKA